MMRKAIFLTAYNRPEYFRSAMTSWRAVRGLNDWDFTVRLEPSSFVDEHIDIVRALNFPRMRVIVNSVNHGVLHHPWVGFEELFFNNDFVVRGEDDLLVSDDILEYFDWASDTYKDDSEIAVIGGYSDWDGEPEAVHRMAAFNPLTWGTWKDRWTDWMRDTWDHDYSTNNGTPGIQAGWDWNLNTRLMPAMGLKSIFPYASRVQNIGLVGTHSTPDNFVQTGSFQELRDPVTYEER